MKSIRFQLWMGMMILIVVVLLLLWFIQIVFLGEFYTTMHIAEIKKDSQAVIEKIQAKDVTASQENLDIFAFNYNLGVELLDSQGESLYITGDIGPTGQVPMAKNIVREEAVREVLAGKSVDLELTHPRYGNKFRLLGFPLIQKDKTYGALMINVSLVPVQATVAILKKQLMVITLILLLSSFVIAYLISRRFTRPIQEIKKVAEAMAVGDYSTRLTSWKPDEIGKLAKTVNYLGEQLSQVEQLRKDLIANVSHELRTPLSIIQGYAETIRDVSGDLPEKRERHIAIIIEETNRLSQIVGDILNLSQLQSKFFEVEKKPFPLERVLQAISQRFSILSEQTGVKLNLQDITGDMVEAEEARIEQVLYNLINNAFNHTKTGGIVTLKTIDLPGEVRVEISDTGHGIKEEELPYIWDRYYKAENRTSGKVGTGLGLAIVKTILEAHHVDYGVESKLGEGTTFWFKLQKETPSSCRSTI